MLTAQKPIFVTDITTLFLLRTQTDVLSDSFSQAMELYLAEMMKSPTTSLSTGTAKNLRLTETNQ